MSNWFNSLLVVTAATYVMAGPAHATLMMVQIDGEIDSKAPQFLNSTPVKLGDRFTVVFGFDDAQESTAQVSVNGGELYEVVTQPFTPALLTWSGTMPSEIAQFTTLTQTGAIQGAGVGQSWYRWFRSPETLHHDEWRIRGDNFEMLAVTNLLGGRGYGRWTIGTGLADNISSNTIDWGGFNVVGFSVMPVPPEQVPEPGTLALLALGLAGIGYSRRKQ